MQNEKIAIVTGASSGIGKDTAILLAQKGYKVCVNYNTNKEGAEEVVQIIRDNNGNAISVKADVSNEAEVKEMFYIVDTKLGVIDALVNNAGIVAAPRCSIEDITIDRINKVFQTNVIGTFLCCKEAVLRMSKKHNGKGGNIVNISSVASKLGSPQRFIDYASTKGAVETLTVGLAKEVASNGIRVNCVRPGYILTPLHNKISTADIFNDIKLTIPMQRIGKSKEVANAIYWLLSDDSSYSTGIFLDVTGGI